MPQRKVLQSVILHRSTGRVVPTVGSIFDFTTEELESLNRLNPNALGRPVQEIDVENLAAQQKAAADEAAQKAADEAAQKAADEAAQKAADEAAQKAADEAAAAKGKNKGGKPSDDDV